MELGRSPDALMIGLKGRVRNMGESAIQKLLRGEMNPKKYEKLKQLYRILNIEEEK